MRVIIALALFAVAYADVKVVNLPRAPLPSYTKPDISPAWVPEEVMAAVKAAEVLRDDLTVHVVDAPLETIPAAITLAAAPEPAVEAPVESPQIVVPVRIVDAALPVVESAPVDPVRIVDVAQPAVEPVRIVDAPLPAVEAVRVVEAPRYPAKQYDNPLLR